MKTENREVHITNDGKEFFDLTDAMTHQATLENEVEVDEFIASLGEETSERAKSRVRNDIMKFLGFKAMKAAEDVKDTEE